MDVDENEEEVVDENQLPDYAEQLRNFHRTFEKDLVDILARISFPPAGRVLDLACGDGFYSKKIAQRLSQQGLVNGVDKSPAYLKLARHENASDPKSGRIDYVEGSIDRLPFSAEIFDVVWCAQSFYSLPDPKAALKEIKRVLKIGGSLAILENDSIHQILLPWPAEIEIELRAAEFRANQSEAKNPSKFYIGRRLPAVLAEAGFETIELTTQAIDRRSPLASEEKAFLTSYLKSLLDHAAPHLQSELLEKISKILDPSAPKFLLNQPHFTWTWVNVLAIGRRVG